MATGSWSKRSVVSAERGVRGLSGILVRFAGAVSKTRLKMRSRPGRRREAVGWSGSGGDTPSNEQVVEHLIHCSERNQAINKDVYRHLNSNASDVALDSACRQSVSTIA